MLALYWVLTLLFGSVEGTLWKFWLADSFAQDVPGAEMAFSSSGLQMFAVQSVDSAATTDSVLTAYDRHVVHGRLTEKQSFIHQNSTEDDGLAQLQGVATSRDGHNVYVSGALSNSIVSFQRDESGNLTMLQILRGYKNPTKLILSGDDSYVYVLIQGDNALAVFERSPINGTLTFLMWYLNSGELERPLGMTISSDDRHIYVTAASSYLFAFNRDTATGRISVIQEIKLTDLVSGVFFATCFQPALTLDDEYLYAPVWNADLNLAFIRDSVSGTLQLNTIFSDSFRAPVFIGMHPDNVQVLVLNSATASLTIYARSGINLTLQEAFRQGNDGVDGLAPGVQVISSPDGNHLYVTGNNKIAIFQRDISLTPSPTMTRTPSASLTPIPTPTPTQTGTPTTSHTLTTIPTHTPTPTCTPTVSVTPSCTSTGTRSSTATPSTTPTPTLSGSPTYTPTPTRTPQTTITRTVTQTLTPTPTLTDTPSRSQTPTCTRSTTRTGTSTPSRSATPTPSLPLTPTASPTGTPSGTTTSTLTASVTGTPTSSATPSRTGTSTVTRSRTLTRTPTSTCTVTPTPTPSTTSSATSSWTYTTTPSPTAVVTPTPSVSLTIGRTHTWTVTQTSSGTLTSSPTRTLTPTATPSPTFSLTRTQTASLTSTHSLTPSHTLSVSATGTGSQTITRTLTPSSSRTSTITLSATLTPTRTASCSATLSRTQTPSTTHSLTSSHSRTGTRTSTRTGTATRTGTVTASESSTASHTLTGTGSVSETPTTSSTGTQSLTSTHTLSASTTRTSSLTVTITRTSTPTLTGTLSRTVTPTRTLTPTGTSSHSPTGTPTHSPTPTKPHTPTYTRTQTNTLSVTRTLTLFGTPSATESATLTSSSTSTPTFTGSSTTTNTFSATNTVSPTSTFSHTSSATSTPTITFTASLSNTNTFTRSITATSTSTDTWTETCTFTRTPTATSSLTPSHTGTLTVSMSMTVTTSVSALATPSYTPTRTLSTSITITATSTLSPSNTPTQSHTPTQTLSPTPSVTDSRTATCSPTLTRGGTRSFTTTQSATPTPTYTISPSSTPTPTRSVTRTCTVIPTWTPTPTESATLTPSRSATTTPTSTPTYTSTSTATRTSSFTATSTSALTYTETDTQSSTGTATESGTTTVTLTPTSTASLSQTPTASETPTTTCTPTLTTTTSPTSSTTPTLTASPTSSSSPTATSTATPTSTQTPTHSTTDTLTVIPTWTPTPTSTTSLTGTLSVSSTPTASHTQTMSLTHSPTPSPTMTITTTTSSTPTPTSTPTGTSSITQTFTFSPTVVPTHTPTCTGTFTSTSSASSSPTPAYFYEDHVFKFSPAWSPGSQVYNGIIYDLEFELTGLQPEAQYHMNITLNGPAYLVKTGDGIMGLDCNIVDNRVLICDGIAGASMVGTVGFEVWREYHHQVDVTGNHTIAIEGELFGYFPRGSSARVAMDALTANIPAPDMQISWIKTGHDQSLVLGSPLRMDLLISNPGLGWITGIQVEISSFPNFTAEMPSIVVDTYPSSPATDVLLREDYAYIHLDAIAPASSATVRLQGYSVPEDLTGGSIQLMATGSTSTPDAMVANNGAIWDIHVNGVAAKLDSTGSLISVTFPKDINLDAISIPLGQSFDCDLVFEPTTPSTTLGSLCEFEYDNVLTIKVDPESSIKAGDMLVVRSDVQFKDCEGLSCIIENANGTVNAPDQPYPPLAVLQGPSYMTKCQVLRLDASGSRATIRHWKRWAILTQNPLLPSYYPLQEFLQNRTNQSVVEIPAELFGDGRHIFQVEVEDLFGRSDTATLEVVKGSAMADVSMEFVQPLPMLIHASETFFLSAQVYHLNCSMGAAPIAHKVTYRWDCVSHPNCLTERIANTGNSLTLPPHLLIPGDWYIFALRVQDEEGLDTTIFASVKVDKSPLKAFIAGNAFREVSLESISTTLDASASYDPDRQPLTFLWKACYAGIVGQEEVGTCTAAPLSNTFGVTDPAGSALKIVHSLVDPFPRGWFRFEVTIRHGDRTATAETFVNFRNATLGNLTLIAKQNGDGVHNLHEDLVVVASTTFPVASSTWQLKLGGLDLNLASTLRDVDSIRIPGQSLPGGTTRVSIHVKVKSEGSEETVSAEVPVSINHPPRGGSFFLSGMGGEVYASTTTTLGAEAYASTTAAKPSSARRLLQGSGVNLNSGEALVLSQSGFSDESPGPLRCSFAVLGLDADGLMLPLSPSPTVGCALTTTVPIIGQSSIITYQITILDSLGAAVSLQIPIHVSPPEVYSEQSLADFLGNGLAQYEETGQGLDLLSYFEARATATWTEDVPSPAEVLQKTVAVIGTGLWSAQQAAILEAASREVLLPVADEELHLGYKGVYSEELWNSIRIGLLAILNTSPLPMQRVTGALMLRTLSTMLNASEAKPGTAIAQDAESIIKNISIAVGVGLNDGEKWCSHSPFVILCLDQVLMTNKVVVSSAIPDLDGSVLHRISVPGEVMGVSGAGSHSILTTMVRIFTTINGTFTPTYFTSFQIDGAPAIPSPTSSNQLIHAAFYYPTLFPLSRNQQWTLGYVDPSVVTKSLWYSVQQRNTSSGGEVDFSLQTLVQGQSYMAFVEDWPSAPDTRKAFVLAATSLQLFAPFVMALGYWMLYVGSYLVLPHTHVNNGCPPILSPHIQDDLWAPRVISVPSKYPSKWTRIPDFFKRLWQQAKLFHPYFIPWCHFSVPLQHQGHALLFASWIVAMVMCLFFVSFIAWPPEPYNAMANPAWIPVAVGVTLFVFCIRNVVGLIIGLAALRPPKDKLPSKPAAPLLDDTPNKDPVTGDGDESTEPDPLQSTLNSSQHYRSTIKARIDHLPVESKNMHTWGGVPAHKPVDGALGNLQLAKLPKHTLEIGLKLPGVKEAEDMPPTHSSTSESGSEVIGPKSPRQESAIRIDGAAYADDLANLGELMIVSSTGTHPAATLEAEHAYSTLFTEIYISWLSRLLAKGQVIVITHMVVITGWGVTIERPSLVRGKWVSQNKGKKSGPDSIDVEVAKNVCMEMWREMADLNGATETFDEVWERDERKCWLWLTAVAACRQHRNHWATARRLFRESLTSRSPMYAMMNGADYLQPWVDYYHVNRDSLKNMDPKVNSNMPDILGLWDVGNANMDEHDRMQSTIELLNMQKDKELPMPRPRDVRMSITSGSSHVGLERDSLSSVQDAPPPDGRPYPNWAPYGDQLDEPIKPLADLANPRDAAVLKPQDGTILDQNEIDVSKVLDPQLQEGEAVVDCVRDLNASDQRTVYVCPNLETAPFWVRQQVFNKTSPNGVEGQEQATVKTKYNIQTSVEAAIAVPGVTEIVLLEGRHPPFEVRDFDKGLVIRCRCGNDPYPVVVAASGGIKTVWSLVRIINSKGVRLQGLRFDDAAFGVVGINSSDISLEECHFENIRVHLLQGRDSLGLISRTVTVDVDGRRKLPCVLRIVQRLLKSRRTCSVAQILFMILFTALAVLIAQYTSDTGLVAWPICWLTCLILDFSLQWGLTALEVAGRLHRFREYITSAMGLSWTTFSTGVSTGVV